MNLDSHPKRGILKDIDKTALITMRESGMTNQEIAEAMGCSYQTIYKIIGKQPAGSRKPRRRQTIASREQIQKSCLEILALRFRGENADFELSFEGKTVKIFLGYGEICVHFDKIDGLISDIQAAKKGIEKYAKQTQ